MTDLKFKPVEAEDMKLLAPYFGLRPNKTCDSVPLDSFIWRKYYHVQYAIHENKALLWLMREDGIMHSAMPLCKEEDLKKYFDMTVEYFNQVLHIPLKIYLADEEAVEYLHLKESDDFVVTEQVDLKDYLYDGEAMRKLSGKKLHKKKNHLNAFLKEYEGRWEFRRLCCSDRDDVWCFLDRWRAGKGDEVEQHLDYEVEGIHEILRQCLDEEELKILEQYLDENGTMDACGFREYASVFSDLYSDKTTVYTGNPESAGKDGRVETVYDEGICEGVRVVRGNRMFDYSI